MRKINLDKQTIVFIVLAVFLCLELFIFLPLSVKRIVTLSKGASGLRTKLENIKREWPRKDDYQLRKEELATDIELLRAKLITGDDESKLLSFISTLFIAKYLEGGDF